ncbi:hypothetical protein ABID56_001339 [Alkalibacillus flavidus]|uniref:Uncharacterized protein n=1 Tax=Alkalibacillus flavidus TaxID=546021 RepID=A0ABV2KUJ3_9BACI
MSKLYITVNARDIFLEVSSSREAKQAYMEIKKVFPEA